jgi:esterase
MLITETTLEMKRSEFQRDGLKLSYLDRGGDGKVMVALHGHWMEGMTYAPLMAALAPRWRVIALDQRGHGYSDHASSYTRADYLDDLEALFTHLRLRGSVVLLGNSLGGVNAYQFAARHPDQVRALIIEDIGAVMSDDVSFVLPWAGYFYTRDALSDRIGSRLLPYLQDSFRHTPAGWRLAFEPQDMVLSQGLLNGDHWQEWLATSCPALLIRGRQSPLTTQLHFDEMVARRANTQLKILEAGHVAHFDNPIGFTEAVLAFLQEL